MWDVVSSRVNKLKRIFTKFFMENVINIHKNWGMKMILKLLSHYKN